MNLFQMRPIHAAPDHSDCGLRHAEFPCQGALGKGRGSHVAHLLLSELRHFVRRAAQRLSAPQTVSVLAVLKLRAPAQMAGIAARRIGAIAMQGELFFFRWLMTAQNERSSVGHDLGFSDIKTAVAVWCFPSLPRPAILRRALGDFGPKAGDFVWGHAHAENYKTYLQGR